MLKQAIQQFVDTNYNGSFRFLKDKLIKKNFGEQAYNTLMQETQYLYDGHPISLRVHCFMNDIKEHPTCKMCDRKVVFNSNKGWLTYCSNECRYKDFDCIQDKKRKTNLEKYGATNVLASRYVLDTRPKKDSQPAAPIKAEGNFLTEHNLKVFITHNITDNFLHNKKLPESDQLKRYDFILLDTKTVIEFDGPQHYTQTQNAINDKLKTQHAESLGYKVVRIPYFVQLDDSMILQYFGINQTKGYFNFMKFPHGFHDARVVFPADYCDMGRDRFQQELNNLPAHVRDAVVSSLHSAASKRGEQAILFKGLILD